jgi:acid phosphatase type 7
MNNDLPVPDNLPADQRCSKKNNSLSINYNRHLYAYRWRVVLISVILLSILFPVVVYADQALVNFDGASPGDEVIVWGPYITKTTHNSTVIHWKTLTPSVGKVGCNLTGIKTSGISGQSVSENNSSLFHELPLNNLSPGQRYSYWIGNSSQDYSFRTLPLDGQFTFIVYGDTREQLPWWNQSTHHALVAASIAKEPECLFVVHTGDFVNDPADEGEWGRFFEAAGPMLASTTFFPVPGNHEGDLLKYEGYFRASPWYNFTVAGFEFIIIDSNSLKPDIKEQQNQWINQTLSGSSNGRFVFLHHPMYTSEPNHWGGFLDVRQKWETQLVEHNVIGVFSAHVHAYEHFYENGIHYFTLGTGGAPFYPLAKKKPDGYRNCMENTLAYARVTVNAKSNSALIEVIKVAYVHDGQITMYPPGTVAERIVISRFPGKQSDALTNSLSGIYPLFKTPFRFFT